MVEKTDLAELQRQHPDLTSVEHAAREARYAFFAGAAAATGAQAVAVGHTADDQVETVLLHILRGAGTHGLGGMAPESLWKSSLTGRAVHVCRPLLHVLRAETHQYCQELGIEFQEDCTNLSATFLRNRLRLSVLPQLRDINPQVDRALLRLAEIARQEDAYWGQQVSELWPRLAVERKGEILLRRAELGRLAPSLRQRIVLAALARAAGDETGIGFDHVTAALSLLDKGAGKRRMLARGLEARTTHGGLIIRRARDLQARMLSEGPVTLTIPGTVDWRGWRITARVEEGALLPAVNDRWTAHLDPGVRLKQATVRGRRNGDRFQPLGMPAAKKLQDCLVDAYVPRDLRDSLPILEVEGQIAWVAGLRVAEQFKVGEDTVQTVIVRCEPNEPWLVNFIANW